MRRTRFIAAVTLAAVLAVGLNVVADGATLSSWKAPVGSNGYNGYATIVTSAAGTGTLRVVAKRLTRGVSYPVEIRSGTCTGTRLFVLTTVKSSSTGTIVKSYALSATRATQVLATAKLYIRVGSSTRARCGRFVGVAPGGATSGTTIRVPAGAYGGGLHLHTVQAFETWTPAPGSYWQPGPGNLFVTALVRIDAKAAQSYNLFHYKVRDTDGLQYEPTIGREPSLHSGELASGTFVAGWVTFEVPAANATSLTLVYNPTLGVTVLVKLTPLPGPLAPPAPTPAPTPGPCVPGGQILCMGQTTNFGTYSITVNSAGTWTGDANTWPAAGRVLITAHVTEVLVASATPPVMTFTVSNGSLATPGRAPAFTQPVGSSPVPTTVSGFVTFEVPAAAAGSLILTVNGTMVVRLY